MAKNFVYGFILFIISAGLILYFNQDSKEELIKDKNIETSQNRQLKELSKKLQVKDINTQRKIKKEKTALLEKKIEEIKVTSQNIDEIILKAEKLIKDNNLVLPEQKEVHSEEMSKIKDKIERLKADLQELNSK